MTGNHAAFRIGEALSELGSQSLDAFEDVPLRERVRQILNLIRPAVQSDGGDLELVDVTSDGLVLVRLHGACVGCPSSQMTLKAGIERNLLEHVPGVTGVESVS